MSWHRINVNEKIFSHYIAEKIIFHKYSFQRVPIHVEKLRKFRGFLELHNVKNVSVERILTKCISFTKRCSLFVHLRYVHGF